LGVRVIDNAAALGGDRFRALPAEPDRGPGQAAPAPTTVAQPT
jgi:hypothetical protein